MLFDTSNSLFKKWRRNYFKMFWKKIPNRNFLIKSLKRETKTVSERVACRERKTGTTQLDNNEVFQTG